MPAAPGLRVEKALLRAGHLRLAAVDEVGRGALSGPVTVGVVIVDATVTRPLRGVRDSKLLTPAARTALVPRIRRWVVEHAVGHASAAEIDTIGIIAALRLAGQRALHALSGTVDMVLLDGQHDYLTPVDVLPGQDSLFGPVAHPPVTTLVKADLRCASVAAASVLAKTARDALMVALAEQHPGYGWAVNKGYATPEHLDALRRLGWSPQHRQSWRLPAPGPDRDPAADPLLSPTLTESVLRPAAAGGTGDGEADAHHHRGLRQDDPMDVTV